MGTVFRMKSCCCCSLWTGSLIITIIDVLSALTTLIFAIVLVTDDGHILYWDRDIRPISGFPDDRIIMCCGKPSLKVLLYLLAFMTSILIISDIVLFFGILEERLTLVGAWVFAYIASFFCFIVIISISVVYANSKDSAGYGQIIEFALFYLGYKVFFIIVVRSYAKTLEGGVTSYDA